MGLICKSLVLVGLLYTLPGGAIVPPDSEMEYRKVLGAPLFWDSRSAATKSWLSREIQKRADKFSLSWDPDCLYRPKKQGKCVPSNVKETQELSKLAEAFRKETNGFFDYRVKVGKGLKRDYGGMGQGMFLEKLARDTTEGWYGNFAGDIFVSSKYPFQTLRLNLAHPLHPMLVYATIKFRSGAWVIVQGGSAAGNNIRDPRTGQAPKKEDFERVVLFADTAFHGGRLDAWATAIVAGGHKVLKSLWKKKEFKGKWAYLLFLNDGRAKCSPNLACDLNDRKHRTIKLSF